MGREVGTSHRSVVQTLSSRTTDSMSSNKARSRRRRHPNSQDQAEGVADKSKAGSSSNKALVPQKKKAKHSRARGLAQTALEASRHRDNAKTRGVDLVGGKETTEQQRQQVDKGQGGETNWGLGSAHRTVADCPIVALPIKFVSSPCHMPSCRCHMLCSPTSHPHHSPCTALQPPPARPRPGTRAPRRPELAS